MAKNISLLGADYPDVPAVVLPKTGGGSATFLDVDDINDIIIDEAIASASKQYQIPARTIVLILARCNANQANTSPSITITGGTQTATNSGAAGGSCMCYMLYGSANSSENITISFSNYTSGGTYNNYGRVTILKLKTF